jgi:ABC-2 type transport system ATP-binding protein
MAEAPAGGDVTISVRDLLKEYGSTAAVDGVSFDVHRDEIFALVGPNGAGKTTLVEMIECLRTPTRGSISVLGHDAATEPRTIKAAIGVLPQDFQTFDRLTVRENIALTSDLYADGLDPSTVIDRLDLEAYADARFRTLSGGWKQRTGLAMAIVSDPEVLFLDEPTQGLDPSARRRTWEQIERLADAGTSVVLTTHYMDEVEELADRAGLLVDGALLAVDSVPNLIDQYGGDVKLVVRAGRTPPGEALERHLETSAEEVYRTETEDLVGLFEERSAAQVAFGDLDSRAGDRSIDLVSAGMEDVFLRLAGGTVDAGGDLA